ncbi:MAG: PH domain-containing protein [Acidobacteria bacterium]|nr:PH domain-containing protein [Acidobacteriota bacterium]
MKVDRKTGEPILFEFRRFVLSGALQVNVAFETFPWRSFLLGFVVLLSLLALFGPEGGLVGLPVLCALVLVEMWNRRDFATPRRIVSRSGILGERRIEIPFEEIERVEFAVYPNFPERAMDIGEVTILGDRIALTFSGIRQPGEIAQHLLDLKNRDQVRNEIVSGAGM